MTGEARTHNLGLNSVCYILKAVFLSYSAETMEDNGSTF